MKKEEGEVQVKQEEGDAMDVDGDASAVAAVKKEEDEDAKKHALIEGLDAVEEDDAEKVVATK